MLRLAVFVIQRLCIFLIATNKKFFIKLVNQFHQFCKLDSNDNWVSICGSTECSHNHNIRKNDHIMPWNAMDMNWLDFLDVIDCYRRKRVAQCSFCKKCKQCRQFKLLCAKAKTITLNSWDNVGSFVVAVRFNFKNYAYPMLCMNVDILNRRIISNAERQVYKNKEHEILFEKVINQFRNEYYW